MPTPDAQRKVEEFRQALLALESQQTRAVIAAYRPVQNNIDRNVMRILTQAQSENLSRAQVMRLRRMSQLRAQIIVDVARYQGVAGAAIIQGQSSAVALAQGAAYETMAAGLPPGVTPQMMANVGLEWNKLPSDAFANFVGISRDGAPIGNLLAPLGADTANAITETIGEGIAMGRSPRDTAVRVTNASGMALTRSLTVARTETNRAYREASRLQYAANPNLVKGYQRNSAKDDRVCIACLILDGELYENDEPLDAHINCRCAIVPVTVTYEDLGLDVPMPPEPENGKDWFSKQDEATQSSIMGSKRFDAWKSGSIGFNDMVQVTDNPVWGKSAGVAPLK